MAIEATWIGKIWATGGSKVVTIPKALLDTEIVKEGINYRFELKEIGGKPKK